MQVRANRLYMEVFNSNRLHISYVRHQQSLFYKRNFNNCVSTHHPNLQTVMSDHFAFCSLRVTAHIELLMKAKHIGAIEVKRPLKPWWI